MKTRRLNHIFKADGRGLIVAMDHGALDGPMRGLEHPDQTIAKIIAGGADAVLTTYGVARAFAKQLAPLGLILRIDGGSTSLGTGTGPSSIQFTIESALRLGADAVAVCAYPGSVHEESTLLNLTQTVEAAHAVGMVVLAEMVPGGFDSGPEFRTLKSINSAARIGAELGADIIKCPYVDGFEAVIATTYVPVVILGGAKQGSERDMLVKIKGAIDVGGAGVAVGRNIWQAADTTRMTAAVAAIVHHGATVDEAMKLM
ncbi:MAG TPA: deoxyribose-phosphate aldolase [Anaerolineae bacterium]|jgi:DhnA family fructose-bisphosphate aldolase class Ia